MYEQRQAIINNQFEKACLAGNFKQAKFLIEEGADPSANNNDLLTESIYNYNLKLAKFLIELGLDVNKCNDYMLWNICKNGYVQKLEFLIENGYDIKKSNFNERGKTPLFYACENNHLNLVKYIISLGVDIAEKDNLALREASRNGHLEILTYFIIDCNQDVELVLKDKYAHDNSEEWALNYKDKKDLNEKLKTQLIKTNKTLKTVKI